MINPEPVSVVLCLIGEEHYAIPVTEILEVTAMVQVTSLPEAPPEVIGVVNRHESLMPLLDLRLCLGKPAAPPDPTTLFVVVACEGMIAGLVVDDVRDVITLPGRSISLPTRSGPYIEGMAAVKRQSILVLDVAALLRAFAPSDVMVEEDA